MMRSRRWFEVVTGSLCTLLVAVTGCESPFSFDREDALRDGTLASYRQQLQDARGQIEIRRGPSDVEFQLTPQRRAELDAMSGMAAYSEDPLELGPGLDPSATDDAVVFLSMRDAVHRAVANNLELRQARLLPAIAQQQVIFAEARFDVDYFANINWAKEDAPSTNNVQSGQSDTISLGTGVRKRIASTGGIVELRTDWTRFSSPALAPPFDQVRNRYHTADLALNMRQPLLQGFGPQVNMAEIVIARNTRSIEVLNLKRTMIDLVVEVEQAYWGLVLARDRLLILTRLLNRTVEDRNRLEQRKSFDVTPVRLTEANSFVELRRADVIAARQSVRVFSDRLKRLMNDPKLPLADETLILPADRPMQQAISYNLLDAVVTALEHRPEMRQALLNINDASVRLAVADNARLPVLDLVAGVTMQGLDNAIGSAYADAFGGDYISYLVGGQFEMPIGNRGPQARFEEATLRRQASVLAYQREAQNAVLEIKNALREVTSSYELIGANRAARRAAADSLRAIEEQERAGIALTPEFLLDLKLQTQSRLADAEIREVDAQINYNNAITVLYRQMGIILERKGITFNDHPEYASFVLFP